MGQANAVSVAADQTRIRTAARSIEQAQEVFRRQPGVAYQATQEASIERPVIGDGQIHRYSGSSENHVAAALAVEDPAGLLERATSLSSADDR
jgi:hypothetical protein